MKGVLKVIGVIAVLIAILLGSLGVVRNFKDAGDADEMKTQIASANEQIESLKNTMESVGSEMKGETQKQIDDLDTMINKIPGSGTFTLIGVLIIGLIIICLMSAVYLFKPNMKMSTMILGAAVFLTVLIYFMSPDIETGKYGPMAPRKVALLAGIPAIICAGFAFLVAKMSPKKVEA